MCAHVSYAHCQRQVFITDYAARPPQEVSVVLAGRKDFGRRIPSGSSLFSIVIRPCRHTGQSFGSQSVLHWSEVTLAASKGAALFALDASSFRQHSSLSLRQRLASRP